jgi:hypothetical protein
MPMLFIKTSVGLGTNIEQVAKDMVQLMDKLSTDFDVGIEAVFNNTTIRSYPGNTYQDVMLNWQVSKPNVDEDYQWVRG